jgi:hypothetical protein
MRWGIMFLVVFLSGCAKNVIPPEVIPYIEMFKVTAEKYNVDTSELHNIIYEFKELDAAATVGQCEGSYYITIDPIFWNRATNIEKKILIFHETGHCFLNRRHKETLINNRPVSLMYPNLIAISVAYSGNEENYEKELFTNQ